MINTLDIPANFARTTIELHGDMGREWLAGLPSLLDRYADRWSLTLAPPFAPLSYNYVAPARSDGAHLVVKAGVPCRELLNEIDALRLYDGESMVRLLDADRDDGIMLIERLIPGTTLLDEPDDERATAIAAGVMLRLRRPPPAAHTFPSVADWGAGLQRLRARFDGGAGPFPEELVDRAEHLFGELLASMSEPVLLHGDLHHGNILAAERAPWLAIDPKGVVGEPACEVGAWLRNPMPGLMADPNRRRVTERRVDQFAELLELDRARVIGWGLAQSVLSAWWSFEDHGGGWEPAIACAELLATL
jgi:streptomycin 6-kinase